MLDHIGPNISKEGENKPMTSKNAEFVRGPYLHNWTVFQTILHS